MSINIPHNYEPLPHQLEFLRQPHRFKIAVWHRRGGKSKTALNAQIIRTQIQKGVYYYFLPTYKQAKSVIWDELINLHCPKEIIQKKNDSELAIYYKNGSIQRFVGCEDPDRHRGINPVDVVFDEYSEMDEKIWTAIIQPVLRQNKGTATFIFTPKGKNHSWKLIQASKEKKHWHTSVKNVDDTKLISQEELDDAKKEMPQDLYQQEFMCNFLEGAGSFFKRVQNNIYTETQEIENKQFQIGVDLAKYQDWTVITPFCMNDFYVYPQERFNQMDYNLQKSKIEASYLRHNKASNSRVVIDSTGVGEPVFDDLRQRGINIEPFHFTATSRESLLRNLQIMLEQDRIKIPNDEGLIDELESVRYVLGKGGRVKIQVPDGLHDDRVMSLALAVWGIKEPITNVSVTDYANASKNYMKGITQINNPVSWEPDFENIVHKKLNR